MTNTALSSVARIRSLGLVPVIRAATADEALRAIEAVRAGGIDILEITMTVPGAVRVIEQVVSACGGDVLVGAGTVLDAETARACILAGAQFVVSPALNLATVELCRRYGIPVMPGALTPTEILTAWEAGADIVKVFPCSAMGGASYLKALKAPLPQVDLIPTGGVSLDSAGDFLAAGASALGIGGDLVDLAALRDGRGEVITERAKRYVEIVRNFRVGDGG